MNAVLQLRRRNRQSGLEWIYRFVGSRNALNQENQSESDLYQFINALQSCLSGGMVTIDDLIVGLAKIATTNDDPLTSLEAKGISKEIGHQGLLPAQYCKGSVVTSSSSEGAPLSDLPISLPAPPLPIILKSPEYQESTVTSSDDTNGDETPVKMYRRSPLEGLKINQRNGDGRLGKQEKLDDTEEIRSGLQVSHVPSFVQALRSRTLETSSLSPIAEEEGALWESGTSIVECGSMEFLTDCEF